MNYRNSEGYSDSTAGAALAAVKKEEQAAEEKRVNDLIRVLKYIVRSAGFELNERIQLKDMDTGKVYR